MNNENNITPNNNEPIVLGELKKEKSSKPLFVAIVFILVLGTCFGLPYLEKYFNKEEEGYYLNDNNPARTTTKTDTSLTLLEKDAILTDEKIFIENIKISNNKISYKITAKASDNLSLKFYYLEIYDINQKLLGKIKLTGYVGSASNNKTDDLSFKTNSSDYYLKLINAENENIADLNVNTLTCSLNNNTYTYTFENNLLTVVKQELSESNKEDLNTYMTSLTNSKAKSDLIKTFEGSISAVEESDNGYTFTATLDLSKIKVTDLGDYADYNYYSYNTLSKLISYDMIFKGFDCK